MKVRFDPAAQRELIEAIAYYRHQNTSLGLRFSREVSETTRWIGSNPYLGAVYQDATRQKLLRQFPYVLFYTELEGEIVILAIMHQHRKPRDWSWRIKAN